jgi:hypothetical protein
MSRERYVIIGLAKTGTTAIAMTLRNTLRIQGFCMEPQNIAAVEAEPADRVVIKFLFDHWANRADELRDFLCDTSRGAAPTKIIVVRDPRDEAISRLYYFAYNYFSTRPTTDDDHAAWLEIFRRKEAAPQSVGLVEMQNELISRFGMGFLITRQMYELFARFIDDILASSGDSAHLLRYEDFVGQNIPPGPVHALLSGSRNVGSAFRRVHRRGSSGDWHAFLTDDDLASLNGLCESYLRRFDYPFERNAARVNASDALSKITGSDYVNGLITEARRDFRECDRIVSA